jgi:sialic acid synthase SpsE
MADELAMQAIGRIERALDRIEAAADAAADRTRQAQAAQEDLIRLRRTHDGLRIKVEGAIDQIDRLLAGRGAG